MCNTPCDKIKHAVCQHEHGCDGPFFMPCGNTCFEYETHWSNKQPINYRIPECDKCNNNT